MKRTNLNAAPRLSRRTFVCLSAAVSAAALGALAGCSNGGTADGGSGDAAEDAPAEDDAASAADDASDQGSDGDLGLVTAGKLTVGSDCDYPPFIWMDGEQPQGFEYDMLSAMCEKMGLELNFLAPQNFDTLVASIAAGGIMDVAVSSITINDTRREECDFTEPYFDSNLSVSVMADSGYESLDDLDGLKVAVQSGTTGADWAQENLTSCEIVNYNDQSSCFAALQSGRADAVCIDLPVAEYMINSSYPDCTVLERIATGEQYGIAVSYDNPALRDALNEALQAIRDDGTYDDIYASYFGSGE